MLNRINIRGKILNLPAFFPDATSGFIKSMDSNDLNECNIDGVVVNTYHLLKNNFIDKIEKKGIHNYMNFNKPIVSDSGGFQIMSLIHQSPELGKIHKNKIIFLLDSKKIELTPESCIQLQLKIGSDIIMCLDDCTRAESSFKEQEKSVERTIRWAKKCKKEFEKLTKNMKNKPKIFAIVQGGDYKKLRKKCAESLIKMGFDGYSFGGFPVKKGKLMKNMLEYVSNLLPDDKPKYAMGIGKPQDIIDCVKLGYNIFDCVIPTRDARHKRLFIPGKEIKIKPKYFNEKFECDCRLCKNFTLTELHNFFQTDRKKAEKLATIHNLKTYSNLMKGLQ